MLTDEQIRDLEHEIEVYRAYRISGLARMALTELQELRAARGVTLSEEDAALVLARIAPSSTFLKTSESAILLRLRAKLRARGGEGEG